MFNKERGDVAFVSCEAINDNARIVRVLNPAGIPYTTIDEKEGEKWVEMYSCMTAEEDRMFEWYEEEMRRTRA